MGSVGDAYDNSLCESFFATLECELLDRQRLRTHADDRAALFEFLEGWYNPRRRHSALGYLSPTAYERTHAPYGRHIEPGCGRPGGNVGIPRPRVVVVGMTSRNQFTLHQTGATPGHASGPRLALEYLKVGAGRTIALAHLAQRRLGVGDPPQLGSRRLSPLFFAVAHAGAHRRS